MKNNLINTMFIASLAVSSNLMAGGNSGTTGQILDLPGNEQLRIMMVNRFEYQNALGAVKFNYPMQIASEDWQNPTPDTRVWPRGINIHGGLPFVRSTDENGEDVYLFNRDFSTNRIENTESGFRFTRDWQNVAFGGSSGTTGAFVEYLEGIFGIDAATVNPETFDSIYDLIEDQNGNNPPVNVENNFQFVPYRFVKVNNIPVIEGVDDSGRYLYLINNRSHE